MEAYVEQVSDDPARLLKVMPYYYRHLEGDTTAWCSFKEDILNEWNVPIESSATFPQCCETPDTFSDGRVDDVVCRNCGKCFRIGPFGTLSRGTAIYDCSRTNVTYERINHWNEFMNCVLCREKTPIPVHVIDTINHAAPTSVAQVKRLLREHRFQKYYKNAYTLYFKATKQFPVMLSSEQEQSLVGMFRTTEESWLRTRAGAKRHNFLRNTFLLGMFARILWAKWPHERTTWTNVIELFLPKLPALSSAAMTIWIVVLRDTNWGDLSRDYDASH